MMAVTRVMEVMEVRSPFACIISITSITSIRIDTGEAVWYHLPCVTGDRGGYGSNALGEILMAGAKKWLASKEWSNLDSPKSERLFRNGISLVVGSFVPIRSGSAHGFLVRSM
jgi:hypothetical protein